MKIGMTSLTFRKQNIHKVFEFAKSAGIEGIEWGVHENHIRLMDAERAETVKKLSAESGIEIFSLGSYCNMTSYDECEKTLETANMLGAPSIRLWAGSRASSECDGEYRRMIAENSKKMAEAAEKLSVNLCFEYHPNTLTDNEHEAVKLVKSIDRNNVGLYWQPQGNLTYEQNKAAFETVKPFVLKNIHLNNYNAETGYGYLSDIADSLRGYLENTENENFNLLIEFVKDESEASLIKDADFLKKLLKK